MKDTQSEDQPTEVTARSIQVGKAAIRDTRGRSPSESRTTVSEVRSRWGWVEPAVWTDRMLTALETGVKGGVWLRWPNAFFAAHGLFSMTTARATLYTALQRRGAVSQAL